MRAVFASVLLLAGCSKLFGIPGSGELIGDGGDDDAPDGPLPPGQNCELQPDACTVLAATGELGQTGALLVLEGTFGETVQVTFPGGVSKDASELGTHRAVVNIPAGTGTGAIVVKTANRTIMSAVRFRGTSAPLGIAHFQTEYHQTSGARQSPTLTVPRAFATATAIRNRVFVLGGFDTIGAGTQPLKSLDVGRIDADGSLRGFNKVSGTMFQLKAGRARHAALAIGKFLYVIGGVTAESEKSIERATIAPDGTLSAFEMQPTALVAGRASPTAVVIGDGLFVIGGFAGDGNPVGTVERAPLGADGAIIGPFATVANLATPRGAHTVAVVKDHVFVIGGSDKIAGNALSTMERATIGLDGQLVGDFTTVPGLNLVEARASASTLLLANDILVIGGANATGALATTEVLTVDSGGNLTRTNLNRSLSTNRAGSAVVVVDDNVHLIGGLDLISGTAAIFSNSEMASVNGSGVLDTTWIDPGGLTPQRAGAAGAVIDDGVFLIGGEDGGTFTTDIDRSALSIDSGGLAGFQPSTTSVLQIPRDNHAVAVTTNFAYVFGGRSANPAFLQEIEVAQLEDAGLGQFLSQLVLETPRAFASVAIVRDTLYVFGGQNAPPPNSNLSTIETTTVSQDGLITNPTTAGSVLVSNTSGGRRGHCTVVLRNRVYLVGGGFGASDGASNSIDVCTIGVTGKIESNCGFLSGVGTLPTSRRDVRCEVVGNFLYVVGSNGNSGKIVERSAIDPNTGGLGNFTSSQVPQLVTGRQNHVVLRLGNRVFALGGENVTAPNPTIRSIEAVDLR